MWCRVAPRSRSAAPACSLRTSLRVTCEAQLVVVQCEESAYINSRPFRVNAGPVHAYVQASPDKTAYLAELHAGASVLVVDQQGHHRQEVVGRCKVPPA